MANNTPGIDQNAVRELVNEFTQQANQAKTVALQSQESMRQGKIQTMQKAFQLLQGAGVDPTKPASLQAFRAKLGSAEPDGAALFDHALGHVFDDSTMAGLPSSSDQPGSSDDSLAAAF